MEKAKQKHGRRISVYLTNSEIEKIKLSAQRAGLSESAFIRFYALKNLEVSQ